MHVAVVGSRYTWHGKFSGSGVAWNPYARTSRANVTWMVYFPTVISNDQVQSLITCDFVLIEISFPLKFHVIRGWQRQSSNSEAWFSEGFDLFEVRWIISFKLRSITSISVSTPRNFHGKNWLIETVWHFVHRPWLHLATSDNNKWMPTPDNFYFRILLFALFRWFVHRHSQR